MNNSFWRPFLIVAGAVIILATYAHLLPVWTNKVFPLKRFNFARSVKEALIPTAAADTLQRVAKKLEVPSETKPLLSFIEALDSLKTSRMGMLRVAYFGDSIIEGDLISGRLRHELQTTHGGSGVGLVPITSIVNEFRKTVRHSFSRNWETLSLMNPGSQPLGIGGYTFIPRGYYFEETVVQPPSQYVPGDSLQGSKTVTPPSRKENRRYYTGGPAWVEYAGVDYPGGSVLLKKICLFYSHAQTASQVTVSWDDGPAQTRYLSTAAGVQMLDLSPAAPVKKVRLEFNPGDPIHVYGVSLDDRAGVYVDNFSVRGFSGMYLERIPADYLRTFQQLLDYDLIVLQYGENVSSPDIRDYSFYKRGMTRSIKHLQAALPGVPILVVSAHDRSIRQNGAFQTSPDIPILVNAQSEFAAENGCAFWNVFEAMGGLNSMPGYVNSSPALANLDYTHFTRAGANQIALMLYKLITTGRID